MPDVIVVAQAFPGQFSHQAIDRLRRLAPLARVVGLMGSWCEGEMRTGLPWPGAVRTYWHQWAARCDRELRRLAEGECCSWTLPPTATEEERLLADAECGRAHSPTVGGQSNCHPSAALVLIRARSHEMAEWLSAACRSRGFATVWQRTATAARVEGASGRHLRRRRAQRRPVQRFAASGRGIAARAGDRPAGLSPGRRPSPRPGGRRRGGPLQAAGGGRSVLGVGASGSGEWRVEEWGESRAGAVRRSGHVQLPTPTLDLHSPLSAFPTFRFPPSRTPSARRWFATRW